MAPARALEFGLALMAFSFVLLASLVNVLTAVLALSGFAVYGFAVLAGYLEFRTVAAVAAAMLGVMGGTMLQFCRNLLYLPSTIAVSSHYRLSRLYPLWRQLSRYRLIVAMAAIYLFAAALATARQAAMVRAVLKGADVALPLTLVQLDPAVVLRDVEDRILVDPELCRDERRKPAVDR